MNTGDVLFVNPHHLHHHSVNYEKAYSYARLMEKGAEFPPVKVYVALDGKLIVVNGSHRTAAAKMIGEGVLIEVVGMANDKNDYSDYHKYKPRKKDFWYKIRK